MQENDVLRWARDKIQSTLESTGCMYHGNQAKRHFFFLENGYTGHSLLLPGGVELWSDVFPIATAASTTDVRVSCCLSWNAALSFLCSQSRDGLSAMLFGSFTLQSRGLFQSILLAGTRYSDGCVPGTSSTFNSIPFDRRLTLQLRGGGSFSPK